MILIAAIKYFIKDILLHVELDAHLSLNIMLDNTSSCRSEKKKCPLPKIFQFLS